MEKRRGNAVMLIAISMLAIILLISCSPIEPVQMSKGFVDEGPSIVYGKIVDQNNKPIAGEMVVAEWQEKDGTHTAQTITLSKEEALGLGDAGLEGVFLFSRGEISIPFGTPITVKTLPRFTSIEVKASPGEVVDAGRMMLLRSTSPPLTLEEKQREQVEIISQKESIAKRIDEVLSKAKWIIFGVYLSILLSMMIFVFIKKHEKKKKISEFIFRNDMNTFETMKVEDVMAKEVTTVSPDATVEEALEAMMHHHINGVVVCEGKLVRGILTETDFLRKVHGNVDALKLKVREVMMAPILTVQSTASVISVVKLMLKRGIRKIPVVRGNELVGIVSFTDMLKLLNKFFAKHPNEKISSLIDSVEKCCQKEFIVVGRQDTFGSIVNIMKEKNMSYVLVSSAGLSSDRGMIQYEEEMGIITTKDLLEELYKNPHSFDHLRAVNMMHSPLLMIESTKNVIDALEMIEENSIRRMPVRSYNKIVGVLTQPLLLSSIMEYMEKAKTAKKK